MLQGSLFIGVSVLEVRRVLTRLVFLLQADQQDQGNGAGSPLNPDTANLHLPQEKFKEMEPLEAELQDAANDAGLPLSPTMADCSEDAQQNVCEEPEEAAPTDDETLPTSQPTSDQDPHSMGEEQR